LAPAYRRAGAARNEEQGCDKAKHQIFELIGKEEEDGKSKKATKEETEAAEESIEPILENRAILDSKAGAPLVRRGARKK